MENIHSGHRSRVRKKYLKNGIEVFEPHEILELLLFYTNPRGDTNPTGHELINKFGSVDNVLHASASELKKVNKVGDKTAEFLRFIGEVSDEYLLRESRSNIQPFDRNVGMQFAKNLFADNIKESRLYVVFLGAKDGVLAADLLAKGDYSYSEVDIRALVMRVIQLNAHRIVLVHNHTNGSVLPSNADIEFSRKVEKMMAYIDVEMNDHILVAGNTAVSICNDMLKKKVSSGLTRVKK